MAFDQDGIEPPGPDVAREQGVGATLSRAREGLQLSQADVAGRLRLTVTVIDALENERAGDLPEPAYVFGYIRSYASLLELDPDPLVSGYRDVLRSRQLPPQNSGRAYEEDGPSGRILAWIALAVVVVILALLVGSWLMNSDSAPEAEPSTASAYEADSDDSGEHPVTEGMVPEGDGSGVPTGDEQPPAENAVAEQSDSQVADTAAGTVPPPAEEAAGRTDDAGEPQAAPAAAMAPTATPGGDALTLRFTKQSWTEVSDADGKRLLFDLVKAGVTRELHGKAPFSLKLGDAEAVRIELNGRSFSIRPFIRPDRTARFQVPSPAN